MMGNMLKLLTGRQL